MSIERTTLTELRRDIDEYKRAQGAAAPIDNKWAIVILTAQCAAWKAAYSWHHGVMQELIPLISRVPVSSADLIKALMTERDEGATMIRERLR